jgi:integrative and conjugative element protein (TIGR02256 family)
MSLSVEIEESARSQIERLASESIDGRETGGILLGHEPKSADQVLRVHFAGDAGPAAVRRPDFFLRDLEHARGLAASQWDRSRFVWIGEWHTHLHGDPRPSRTDLATYAKLLAKSELQFKVFVAIIVVAGAGSDWTRPLLTPWLFSQEPTDGAQ